MSLGVPRSGGAGSQWSWPPTYCVEPEDWTFAIELVETDLDTWNRTGHGKATRYPRG